MRFVVLHQPLFSLTDFLVAEYRRLGQFFTKPFKESGRCGFRRSVFGNHAILSGSDFLRTFKGELRRISRRGSEERNLFRRMLDAAMVTKSERRSIRRKKVRKPAMKLSGWVSMGVGG